MSDIVISLLFIGFGTIILYLREIRDELRKRGSDAAKEG